MAYVVLGGLHPAEATGAADAEVLDAVDAVHDGRRHDADAVEGTSAGRRLETRVTLRLRQRLIDHLGHLITKRHRIVRSTASNVFFFFFVFFFFLQRCIVFFLSSVSLLHY